MSLLFLWFVHKSSGITWIAVHQAKALSNYGDSHDGCLIITSLEKSAEASSYLTLQQSTASA
jgi:hypothetical protein